MKDEGENGALPEGWAATTIGAAAVLSKAKVDPVKVPDSPYLGLKHVEANTRRIIGQGCAADVKSAKNTFRAGNVLYGKLRPYLNKVAQPDFDGICSTDFLVFERSPVLDAGFFAWFVSRPALVEFAHHASNGVELPRVGWKALAAFPMALPPLVEQRRIAERLDEIEDYRGSIYAYLQAARTGLDRLRKAVPAAACSGRLTAEWRDSNGPPSSAIALNQKRETDRARLESKYVEPRLPDADALPDIPEGWCWALLPELGEMGRGKSRHRPRNDPRLYGGDFPFVQTGDVARANGRIDRHTQTYNDEGLAQSRLWPADTVCVTIAANIAESALLSYPACFPDSVVGLVTDRRLALPEYIELFIRTARDDLAAFAPATAQANINLAILGSVAVPLPTAEEQAEIVRRAHLMLAAADCIDARVDDATAALDRAVNAALAKAFRGELVPTEAALAAEEGRDFESAEELLARVMRNKRDHSESDRRR